MTPPKHPPQAPLSPELAFVVQLQGPGTQTSAEFAGRAEHIASGQSTQFASLAELHAFMGQVAQRHLGAVHGVAASQSLLTRLSAHQRFVGGADSLTDFLAASLTPHAR